MYFNRLGKARSPGPSGTLPIVQWSGYNELSRSVLSFSFWRSISAFLSAIPAINWDCVIFPISSRQ
jgi:hypothetical protein